MFCLATSIRTLPLTTGRKWKTFLRANLVLKVDKGYYKNTKLDGASLDRHGSGSDWSTGKDSWRCKLRTPSVIRNRRAR